MSKAELEQWEKRYATNAYSPRERASPLVVTWLDRLARGRALDIACGHGRNAIFLAEHGYLVDAIDISRHALLQAQHRATSLGLSVNWIQADLDQIVLPKGTYKVIVSSFYRIQNLAPFIVAALSPNGILLCEDHMLSPQPGDGQLGEKHRLQPGELRALFPRLVPLHYEEGLVHEQGRVDTLARLVAQKRGE